MIYKFERLIRKYGVENAVIEGVAIGGSWVDGEWVEGAAPTTETLECAIVPMSTQQVYESNGAYTTSDRTMYTQRQMQLKDKITYRGISYSVEEITDYTEYADFFVCTLKDVSKLA